MQGKKILSQTSRFLTLFVLMLMSVGNMWGQNYEELFTVESSKVVSNSTYANYQTNVDYRDWLITFGGNNKSVGTNSNNRSKCTLSSYGKYAVSPVTTSDIASAFVSLTSISDVSKISYTFNGGSNQTSTNVYLIYSSDGNSFSQISLTSGTQGATISSGSAFEFAKCSGYFGLLFKATNSSGNWRIDDVNITFYKAATKQLKSISISGELTNKEYEEGETVDPTGLVVTGHYDDNSDKVLTSGVVWSFDPETLSLGDTSCKLTARFEDFSAEKVVNDLTVKVSQKATYTLYSGSQLVEGDYIICSGAIAMSNEISSDRLTYKTVTAKDDAITTSDESIVWHLAKSGDYWTLYNAVVEKYAAGTGAKNKAQLLDSGTDDQSLWTVSSSDGTSFEFVNKKNTAADVNSNLRYNGDYGFACYSTSTGSALTLYKKDGGGAKTPTITASCSFTDIPFTVTITNNEEGATVYYTTDGIDPTTASGSFSDASKTIEINTTTTVKAMAVAAGKPNSEVVSATFTYIAMDFSAYKALVALDGDKYYAAKNTLEDRNKYFNVTEVDVVNNKVVNCEQKENYTWEVSVKGTVATIQNVDGKYLSLSSGESDTSLSDTEVTLYTEDGTFYCAKDSRAFAYNKGYNRMASYNPSVTFPAAKAMTFAAGHVRQELTKGGWGTICLPYAVAVEDRAGATFYSVAGYRGTQSAPESIVLEEVEGGLVAGQPYVFKASDTKLVAAYSGEAAATAGSANGLVGSYVKADVDDSMYLLSGGKFCPCTGGGNSVGANRAYFDLSKMSAYVPAAGVKNIVEIDFADATGIREVSGVRTDAAGMYNIAGQAVGLDYKGVVIKNGKKYINK